MQRPEFLLRRRMLQVGGRRVHCLRIGSGPPAVFVHSSPTNAWYVEPHMRRLADRNTCFAFDTPGFGLSEPLPGERLDVADLAAALAETLAAAGLPACPVFGTHTGAAIALSLAAHHPERVTAVVLDGVPIFNPPELESLFDGYFEPLAVDDRGGHYARTWTRFRDQYAWFPWTRKTPDRHNETDLGTAAAIHAWVMNFFHAGSTYAPAYRAGIWYGAQAVEDARAATCPAVYLAAATDMLHPHLARLPALRPGQEIRDIGDDRAQKDLVMAEVFARWPAAGPAPDAAMPPLSPAPGPGVRQQFVDRSGPDRGQTLLRYAGRADAPPLLLLHDAPGSGHLHEGLIQALAAHARVLAPDLPGCAGSDPLPAEAPQGAPSLAAFADAMAALCAQVGVDSICVYGIGIGASLALELAERHPALVRCVVLRGLALPDAEERAAMRARDAPRIDLQDDGSHWYRTWLMLRDREIWFPWFEPRARCLRRVAADFGADRLHAATFEVMKRHDSYHQVIDAAWEHDAAAPLARVRQPLALCADPQVPFFAYQARLRLLCPEAPALPCDGPAHATSVAEFMAGAARSP